MTAPLSLDDEAWCLITTKPTPSGRRTVHGAARVRVVRLPSAAGPYRVRVIHGSGVVAGVEHDLPRVELYAIRDRAERAAFGQLVFRIWGAA